MSVRLFKLEQHGFSDAAEGFHLFRGEYVSHVAPNCFFVMHSGFRGELAPGVSHTDDCAPVVLKAFFAPDQSSFFHAPKLV